MRIKYLGNRIIIEKEPRLKSFQLLQLNRLGYKKDHQKDQLVADVDVVEDVLFNTVHFLKKERISYELSAECEEVISKLQNRKNNMQEIKKLGQTIKSKKYNKKQFQDYVGFLNEKIPRKLKDHQCLAGFHLYSVGNGANFSVPGSGKTSVVLSVYEKLRAENKVNTLFVIGPPACFGPWKNEFQETLGRKPHFKVLAGGEPGTRKSEYFANLDNKYELYLTTFQTLLADQDDVITFFRQNGVNVFVVVDEAHYFKQLEGNWASAVLKIANYAKFRCVLTGTPLPRSYTDIFNLFDFLWPGNSPLEKSTKNKIKHCEETNDSATAREELKSTIGPLFYRVSKSELGLTKPVFHKPFLIKMNPYERKVFDSIKKNIRNLNETDYLREIGVVERLRRGRVIRLRQCTSYTKLVSTAIEGYNESLVEGESELARIINNYDELESPAKLEFLQEFVTKLIQKKEKVVIWSNFIGTIELLSNTLSEKGIYCKKIYGNTPIEQTSVKDEATREQIRDEFVDDRSGLNVLIANPAACAESISLHTTCHNALYYDLSYNCAQYIQSLDRIHRVGGSEKVLSNYFFLQYQDSVDRDIQKNLSQKAKKMYEVIEKDNSVFSLDMFEQTDEELSAYDRLFQ